MISETILHYKILEKLGEGGMGIVYKAHDTTLSRNVALKFLPQFLSSDPNEKARFYHEARAAASLMHQNVAVIHEIGEHNGKLFIAMEYVEGQTIKKVIEQKSETLSINKVLDIAIQICEGLAAAHEKEIVHRDIKSDNIMLTSKDNVKLMDFGLAKIAGATKLTKDSSTVGTAAYMSPEQALGEKVDNRSDIFSFGIVLYELLTTHLPFSAEHQAALMYSIINDKPLPIARFNDRVSQELERIVFKTLSKDKNERYQHIEDLLSDLRVEQKKLEYINSGFVERSNKDIKAAELKARKTKWLLKIFIPATIIALLAFLFLIINPFKTKVSGTSGTTSTKKSLAVMYFENIPDPQDKNHTGEIITNLLNTSLSQSKELEVISREQLYKILGNIGQSGNKTITPKTAIEVAQNAGISTILLGSIVQSEPSLAVTIRLIDVNTGNTLGSQRLVGSISEQIFPFVDSLAFLVRKDLNITEINASDIKPVADITTNSPEAYRAYIEGLDLESKLYSAEAVSAFKKAIELDSTFAMAYYHLSFYHEPVETDKSLKKAVELADNVTERERLLIFAKNYSQHNKPARAAEIYKQIIEKYPHEIEAYFSLAHLASNSNLSLNTIDILLRGVHNNPSAKTLWLNLAYSFAYNNQKQEAINAVNKYIKLSPAEPNVYDTKGDIYTLYMEYDSSAVYYKKALEFRKDYFSAMKLGFYDVFKGKYKEAQQYFDMSGNSQLRYPSINVYRGLLNFEINRLEKVLKTNISTPEYLFTTSILVHLYYETEQFQKMLQIVKKSTIEWKKDYPKNIWGRQLLAWALAKNGELSEAYKIIEDIKSNTDKSFPFITSAVVSFEEGEYRTALEKFNIAYSKMGPNHEPSIFYAICLLKTDRVQEAIVQFNHLKNWPMIGIVNLQPWAPGGEFYSYIYNVKAHYWLGVAYEKLGEKEKAFKEYKIFLDIWKDADFDSPELKDAKLRIQKLGT